MNVNDFINLYQEKNPGGHFFDPETLKFFGEIKSEMHVSSCVVSTKAGKVNAYALSAKQHNHPRPGTIVVTYFDSETMLDITRERFYK